MRLRNNPDAPRLIAESPMTVKDKPFKVDDNFIIELGMGKGEMITELAKQNPDKQFLGIEKFATVALKAIKRAEKLEVENFHLICDDIKHLPTLLQGKVKTIWLTFSDPWPKKGHAKRRLTYKSFVDLYKSLLIDGGVLRFKTDNDKFFEWTIEHWTENKFNIQNMTRDLHGSGIAPDNVMTGYEKKWSEAGQNINYCEVHFG